MTVKQAEIAERTAFEALLKAEVKFGQAQGTGHYVWRNNLRKAAHAHYLETLAELRKAERAEGRQQLANHLEVALVGVPSSMAAPGGYSAKTLLAEFSRSISEGRTISR